MFHGEVITMISGPFAIFLSIRLRGLEQQDIDLQQDCLLYTSDAADE